MSDGNLVPIMTDLPPAPQDDEETDDYRVYCFSGLVLFIDLVNCGHVVTFERVLDF